MDDFARRNPAPNLFIVEARARIKECYSGWQWVSRNSVCGMRNFCARYTLTPSVPKLTLEASDLESV